MDKIDRKTAKSVLPPPAARLLSRQVSDTRYFFLNLAPARVATLTPVMGGCEHCNPDYAISRRHFPFYVLEYVIAGRGWVELDDKRHDLEPGAVFAYAPTTHVEMQTDARDPLVKYFVSFAGRGAATRLRQCGLPAGEVRTPAAHAGLTSLFEDIVREGARTGALARRIGTALFELLLLKIADAAALAAESGRGEPARDAFLRCKALIDAQVGRLRTLEEIAEAAGVEASSVCRWFRRFQGTSPYQYLLRRKMNLAAEFLVENGGLVKAAAERVGFADPYHFSRVFKAVHGVAPRHLLRYRRAR
ncbi:MAG TPA: AraC family transcriptional regulator [Opitutaceae bacterium]|nr:AraC family transcriptional regulator [Opitutaceae bacterium]